MNGLRLGLNCSRRAAASCSLLIAPRVSRIHRRWFAAQNNKTNENANVPIDLDVIDCSDSQEWLEELKLESKRVDPDLFQKSSPRVIKVNGFSYPPLFLRDSCSCHQCVDPSTKQKNFQTSDIPSHITATSVNSLENGDLEISWENDIPGYASNHVSTFSKKFFETHKSTKAYLLDRQNIFSYTKWDAKRIAQRLQYVTYDDYMNSEEGLFRALIMLQDYGLLILRGVPESETSVVDIAKRIGNLRDTLYGVTWDVKSVPQAKNVAYTSQYLGLHMDLLYMTNPPGFQFLHCLNNTCSGGSSIFSDSFQAATQLERHHFVTLCEQKIHYHYRNAGEHYYNSHYVIQPRSGGQGVKVLQRKDDQPDIWRRDVPLQHINYSPPFQATFAKPSGSPVLAEALRQFASRVEAPENVYEYRLQEGECVIFNNRRVLHGRKEFDTSTGERWFRGAYIDTDVFMSRYRVLAEKYQNQNREFLRTHARYISWDIQNPVTGRMESDPHKIWETSRILPQTEGYANII